MDRISNEKVRRRTEYRLATSHTIRTTRLKFFGQEKETNSSRMLINVVTQEMNKKKSESVRWSECKVK